MSPRLRRVLAALAFLLAAPSAALAQDLWVSSQPSGGVLPNDRQTIEIRLINSGPGALGGNAFGGGVLAVVYADPPPSLTSVQASGTGWSCTTAANRRVQCMRPGPLAANVQIPPIAFSANVAGLTTYQLCAGVTVIGPGANSARDPRPANNQKCETIAVPPAPSCLMQGVVPMMVVGFASHPDIVQARTRAMADWKSKVPYPPYNNFAAANRTTTYCGPNGAAGIGCSYTGQPCRSR